jgi:hypothetical protein
MDASRTLARLERALTTRGVSLKDFLASHDLSPSTFYKAKRTNNISPQLNKRYLTALRHLSLRKQRMVRTLLHRTWLTHPPITSWRVAGPSA